jgi:hypothetical protein
MCPLLAMSTQSRNLAEVKGKLLGEPVDRVTRFVGEDLDEVVTGQFTCRLLGVCKASGRQLSRT